MKSSAFDYVRAKSPQQVFDLLAQHGESVRLLAGGQTLLAALNMRLSEPALVVDIGGLAAMRGISVVLAPATNGPSGAPVRVLRLGALTRHVEIEESPMVAQHAPLLAQAAPHIAHRAIRNRGTLGGSLAYADPAAEWPACALALDATLVLQSALGERRIAAADFFQGLYTTARRDNEILTAMEVPLPQSTERHHFIEVARRHGDYAVVGLAARAQWAGGRLNQVRLAFLSVADRPWRARQTESVLQAGAFDVARLAAADAALRAELKPMADLTHSEAGKRQIAATLMRRAVLAITSNA
jgi:aerobic carbon-monoxide dehydrogenase medium subunit